MDKLDVNTLDFSFINIYISVLDALQSTGMYVATNQAAPVTAHNMQEGRLFFCLSCN